MKTEIGMYCYNKTNRKLGIGQIISFQSNNNVNVRYKNDIELVNIGNIIASNNIIDLIERGDILHDKNDNEYWTVQRVEKDELGNISIQTEWEGFESEEELLDYIDEIITKEQSKNISYKIGD